MLPKLMSLSELIFFGVFFMVFLYVSDDDRSSNDFDPGDGHAIAS